MTQKFDKNTVIIANYINVSNDDPQDVGDVMDYIAEQFKLDGNIIQLFIPILEGDSHIECVYPKFLISEEEFNRASEATKLLEENLKNIISKRLESPDSEK